MSDVMFFGILEMPYDMAMETELSRSQFYDRVQDAVARIKTAEQKVEEQAKEIESLQCRLELADMRINALVDAKTAAERRLFDISKELADMVQESRVATQPAQTAPVADVKAITGMPFADLATPIREFQARKKLAVHPPADAAPVEAINLIVRDVAELDYSSDIAPNLMQVSEADLRLIIERHIATQPSPAQGDAPSPHSIGYNDDLPEGWKRAADGRVIPPAGIVGEAYTVGGVQGDALSQQAADDAFEVHRIAQGKILGMPGLMARPCFIAGWEAAIRALAAKPSEGGK